MTYFPDYTKETHKMCKEDQEYINGYRAAEDLCEEILNDIWDDEYPDCLVKYIDRIKKEVVERLKIYEVEIVCSIFDDEKYDDLDLKDANQYEIGDETDED